MHENALVIFSFYIGAKKRHKNVSRYMYIAARESPPSASPVRHLFKK
jgi:hypothetical protein